MATRLRKSRRQRGTRYCGWGQIGQHRQSGSRGGVDISGYVQLLKSQTILVILSLNLIIKLM